MELVECEVFSALENGSGVNGLVAMHQTHPSDFSDAKSLSEPVGVVSSISTVDHNENGSGQMEPDSGGRGTQDHLTTVLMELVQVDLSVTSLRTRLSSIDSDKIRHILTSLPEYDPEATTVEERENIQTLATSNHLLQEIRQEHPFRDEVAVDRLSSEFNPYLRRKRFKNDLDRLLYISQWYTSSEFNAGKNGAISDTTDAPEDESGRRLRPRRKPLRFLDEPEPQTEQQPQRKKKRTKAAKESSPGKIAEQDEYNPYGPENILEDSFVPLSGRHIFVESIYGHSPTLPPLVTNIHPTLGVSVDTTASDLITHHTKHYRAMPDSFPGLYSDSGHDVNPNNKIRIRFLLYPMHCEEYILAQPKSNQLDPVDEIIKFFQLNYGLYFSGSPRIKNIIVNDYCQPLRNAVDESDFQTFLSIIDQWNQLVLHISPGNAMASDINPEARGTTREPEVRFSASTLKLAVFHRELARLVKRHDEVKEEGDIRRKGKGIKGEDVEVNGVAKEFVEKTQNGHTNGHHVAATKETRTDSLFPDYKHNFFHQLSTRKTISRYAMHQILSRVYARVVSISSNKLRYYKAFTAEVYGELLPSFTSEVLTKINMKPCHKFYDLGSGVGNTTLQAALEFGASLSGGCELMAHASKLTMEQSQMVQRNLSVFGLKQLNLKWALSQSFADNEEVRKTVIDCDVLIVNNYLFDADLNHKVGKLLYGLRPGSTIISLRNFISPRYKASYDNTVFDYLQVEKHEMQHNMSVSWTANKVPYYISVVQKEVCQQYI